MAKYETICDKPGRRVTLGEVIDGVVVTFDSWERFTRWPGDVFYPGGQPAFMLPEERPKRRRWNDPRFMLLDIIETRVDDLGYLYAPPPADWPGEETVADGGPDGATSAGPSSRR